MPEGVRWTRPGRSDAVARAAALRGSARLEAHLARRGVNVSNASAAFLGSAHLHGFRIAYAFLSEAEMRSALTIVADALRALSR